MNIHILFPQIVLVFIYHLTEQIWNFKLIKKKNYKKIRDYDKLDIFQSVDS